MWRMFCCISKQKGSRIASEPSAICSMGVLLWGVVKVEINSLKNGMVTWEILAK